jgi:hypothetical protein
MTTLSNGVQIVALRRDGRNEPASSTLVLTLNDVVLAVAENTEALDRASQNLGEEAADHLVKDRGSRLSSCVCLSSQCSRQGARRSRASGTE